MRGSIEVADIFRGYGSAYRQEHEGEIPLEYLRAMNAIEICRTAVLGGHVDECDNCGEIRISYNSCRNRHCPKCQKLDKERWVKDREKELLSVSYFHVVFTLPEEIRPIGLRNQRVIYDLLFKAVSQTLLELSRDPKHIGAKIGFTAILHTWSKTLIHHPHIHCIVTGGGLSLDGEGWVSSREDFFIHVKVLSRKFRGKFLAFLKKAYYSDKLVFPGKISSLKEESQFIDLIRGLYRKEWTVFCKPPFGSPEDVIDYLGRYTHRVAISNDRIVKLEEDKVTFRYWDSDEEAFKLMTLDVFEFIRRFLLHILPDNFMKIRYYGILSNRNKKTKLARCRELLGVSKNDDQPQDQKEPWEELLYNLTGVDPRICPFCGKGKMKPKGSLIPIPYRSPPLEECLAA